MSSAVAYPGRRTRGPSTWSSSGSIPTSARTPPARSSRARIGCWTARDRGDAGRLSPVCCAGRRGSTERRWAVEGARGSRPAPDRSGCSRGASGCTTSRAPRRRGCVNSLGVDGARTTSSTLPRRPASPLLAGDANPMRGEDLTTVLAPARRASREPGRAAHPLGQPAPCPAARPGARRGPHRPHRGGGRQGADRAAPGRPGRDRPQDGGPGPGRRGP